ncbi:MAG: M20/M25/M40 family metallo-hydrolase, partial [Planctomycetota bacterium]
MSNASSSQKRATLLIGKVAVALVSAATANAKGLLPVLPAEEVSAAVALYRDLHAAPELSFEEANTADRIANELRLIGAEVTTAVGGHGVVGVLSNGPGKTLMLRCDLDALPVTEETGLDYASKVRVEDERGAVVGVMHACGHDIHMANVVGVARR